MPAAARPRPPLDAARSALVLVDYQQRLMPAIHEADRVLAEAMRLADVARAIAIPILATEQNPRGLGPNAPEIARRCDATLAKMSFDACADGLAREIRARRPDAGDVVIAGCEAHVCLMQTALGLLREGFRLWVVAGACGSRFPSDREAALRRLENEGAVLAGVEMVAFEWMRTCEHERFKDVLAILKAPRA